MHRTSDWDVAVLANHSLSHEERSNLKRVFAAELGASEDKVDLADLWADSPLLRYRVAMYGKLLEGNPQDFREFQLRAWKGLLNNKKIEDLQTAFLEKALS
jgi:predicted nucleotidyltransferase